MNKKYYYIVAIIVLVIAIIGIIYYSNNKQLKSTIKQETEKIEEVENVIYDIYYSDVAIGTTKTYSIQIYKDNNMIVEETMIGSALDAESKTTIREIKISNEKLEDLKEIITNMETYENKEDNKSIDFRITDKIQNKIYECKKGEEHYNKLVELLDSIGVI